MPETPEASGTLTPLGERHLSWWEAVLSAPCDFVYVVQGDPETAIKVGHAAHPRKRMAALQIGNPQTLRLLQVIPGGRSLEAELHQRARTATVRGEWFHGESADLVLLLAECLALAVVEAYDGSMPLYEDWADLEDEPDWVYALEPCQGHVSRGDWSEIAMLWLDGYEAPELAERFDVSAERMASELATMRSNGYELSEAQQRVRNPFGRIAEYRGRGTYGPCRA